MHLDARAVALALGGKAVGVNRVVCPGPGHSPHDRSLTVFLDRPDPSDFGVHSHCGDDPLVCKDYVRRRLGLEPWKPRERGKRRNKAPAHPYPERAPKAISDEVARSEIALAIFRSATPPGGTLGERYLIERIGQTTAWPDDLRFHGSCARRVGDEPERHPAVVALLRDIETNAPRAIQRIFLKANGSDRLRDAMGKASLGPTTGAVVKLVPDDCVTTGLAICEGLEKSLAILAHGWSPIWCTCGTATMENFPALSGIETLTIFADQGDPGQRAAYACKQRWYDAGREVVIITPSCEGHDWSDALVQVS